MNFILNAVFKMESVVKFVNEYKPKGHAYAERTKEEYLKMFKNFENMFSTSNFIELFTNNYDMVIDTLQEKYANNTYWSRVNVFCKFYDIPVTEIPVITNKTVTTRNLYKIRSDIKKITDIKAKAFLSLYTNNTRKAVRRDWATVMVKENCTSEQIEASRAVYSVQTGIFEFSVLNKTNRSLIFEIEDSIKEILKEYISTLKGSPYLYTYKSTDETNDTARIDSFTQYLGRITLKHLGQRMTSTDFRKAMVSFDRDEILNSEETPAKKFELLVESAKGKDHTVEAEVNYYTDKIDNSVRNMSTQTDEFQPETNTSKIYVMEMIKSGRTLEEIKMFLEILKAEFPARI